MGTAPPASDVAPSEADSAMETAPRDTDQHRHIRALVRLSFFVVITKMAGTLKT
jgi:hypothetical protein